MRLSKDPLFFLLLGKCYPMKSLLTFLLVLLIFVMACNQKSIQKPGSDQLATPAMTSLPASDILIEGYLGMRMDQVINRRIKAQDFEHLIEPFRHRNESNLWQSEFWGKWILSAVAAYNYNSDPDLLAIIRTATDGLIATQTADGYIGNYSPASQLAQWDIWGRKYTLLGLLAAYDVSGNQTVLQSAVKLADHLLTQVGEGKTDIVVTGNYRGMPSSSILEPMMILYHKTGNRKYLEFSEYIVKQWETGIGPQLISKALSGIPVSERFPHPESWWSWDNGQKAYEMMSCYEGLLELYRITGRNDYLKAVELSVQDIISNEINLAGSGSAFECFYKGAHNQTTPAYHTMETCVTMTWMKLCLNLLRLTGNPGYADQFEKSTYNALPASLKYDGSMIAKYSPLDGIRKEGEEQCGMHINCCNANGPRAFMLLPEFAVTKNREEIFINLFGNIQSEIKLSDKNRIKISQVSDYPLTGIVRINIQSEIPESFTLSIRIPLWSTHTSVTVNGEPVAQIKAGSYLKINRSWKGEDSLIIEMDMAGRVVELNGYQAIVRGPVLLARDTRFSDGFIAEPAVISHENGMVQLTPLSEKPDNIWISFSAMLLSGTDLEGSNQRQVRFCDFASAGNTWDEDSRYRVWIPRTMDVRQNPGNPTN
jgi:DUF1680 family protein